MRLDGSCHCGAVTFSLESHTPQPYMRCYCSVCRKTAGAGGFAINILGDNETMQVEGREHVGEYRARFNGKESAHRRYFCRICGTALWAWHDGWPELVHPYASAIDTPLPKPAAFVDIMLGSAAPWVALHEGDNIERFDEYPDSSIEDWHKTRGLWVD